MITGQVNSKREAMIQLIVYGAQREEQGIEVIVDTGYSGYLTLLSALIAALDLSSIGTEQLTLADGSEITADLCLLTIAWDGQERTIEIDTLETDPLLGMALLDGFDLNIRGMAGGQVTITAFSITPPSA